MRKKIPQEPNDAAECIRLRELLAHQSPKLRIEIVQDEKSKRLVLTSGDEDLERVVYLAMTVLASGDEDLERVVYLAMTEMREGVEQEWRQLRAKVAATEARLTKFEHLKAQLEEARAELALLKAEKAAGPGPLFEAP